MRNSRTQRRCPVWLPSPWKVSIAITVIIWMHLLVSQFTDFTNTFEKKVIISEDGQIYVRHLYNSTSKSLQAVSDKNPLDALLASTPAQRRQREKAALENQAWIAKKYSQARAQGVSNNLVLSMSNQSQSDASEHDKNKSLKNSSFPLALPSWLAAGAQKQVYLEDEVDSDQREGACKAFNHSILRPTHGCQINLDTLELFCAFANLRVDNTLIRMDRGGERLEDVMGRAEYKEFPEYSEGAFSTPHKPKFNVPKENREARNIHYLKDVLNSLQYPTSKNQGVVNSTCVEMREGTTLFLTRYEYVNLYHTLTDWWNAFFVLTQEQRNRNEKIRVVFLDGHAQGGLDPVWTDVFGPVEFVQHLAPGGVCFERAVFVPPGYIAPLFPDSGAENPSQESRIRCPRPKMMESFGNFFLTAFGLEKVKPIPGKIVIIDRKPYISHPRSKVGSFQRVLEGLDDLKKQLQKISGITEVEIVRFDVLSFREQIRIVREAQILMGYHGAGLTHLAFMDPSAYVLEITAGFLDFFIYLAEWKGIHHQTIGVTSENQLSDRDILSIAEAVKRIISETQP